MQLGRNTGDGAGLWVAFLLTGMLVFSAFLVAPALAQDTRNCDDFTFQEEAQAVLDQDPDDPNGLDSDNDGIACEDLPSRGDGNPPAQPPSPPEPTPTEPTPVDPPAQGDLDCGDFGSQAEAQAELEADPSDPNNLDADNDAMACDTFDFGGGGGATPPGQTTEETTTEETTQQGTTAGETTAQTTPDNDGDCLGAAEVASLGPETESQQEAFSVTGDSFRVNFDVTINDDIAGLVEVDITDEDGLSILRTSREPKPAASSS